ncbi:MAG: hypothetical protein RLZZ96_4 [Bacteroidota bacterium]|jgi:hypothetical protein
MAGIISNGMNDFYNQSKAFVLYVPISQFLYTPLFTLTGGYAITPSSFPTSAKAAIA